MVGSDLILLGINNLPTTNPTPLPVDQKEPTTRAASPFSILTKIKRSHHKQQQPDIKEKDKDGQDSHFSRFLFVNQKNKQTINEP